MLWAPTPRAFRAAGVRVTMVPEALKLSAARALPSAVTPVRELSSLSNWKRKPSLLPIIQGLWSAAVIV